MLDVQLGHHVLLLHLVVTLSDLHQTAVGGQSLAILGLQRFDSQFVEVPSGDHAQIGQPT